MAVVYSGERYDCPACDGPIGNPITKPNGWRCKTCGELLSIYAEDCNGKKNVLKRVSASNLEKGDLVLLARSSFSDWKEVLDISIDSVSHYSIALKGHGVLKHVEADREFNCVEGSW